MRGNLYTQPLAYGLGYQQPVTVANPGAGVVALVPTSGYQYSRLISAVFTLTTSIAAANRYATVDFLGGDGVAFVVNGAAQIVTASLTRRFVGSLSRGTSEFVAGSDIFFPLENIFLEGGTSVRINVANMDAGDTLTIIRLVFEQYTTDPDDLPGAQSGS